jgi:hypothetical protein
MNRIGYDYWADNIEVLPDMTEINRGAATLGDLISKLRNEDIGYINEKTEDGEFVYKYFCGRIVLRGRTPEGLAYKLTLEPKGLLKKTFERNHETLIDIIASSGIKLIRCAEK